MKPMSEAPRDGREVLLVRSGTGGKQLEFRKWCAEHMLWEWAMGGNPSCDFSGWYDIDELIAAASKAERYEKALREIWRTTDDPTVEDIAKEALDARP